MFGSAGPDLWIKTHIECTVLVKASFLRINPIIPVKDLVLGHHTGKSVKNKTATYKNKKTKRNETKRNATHIHISHTKKSSATPANDPQTFYFFCSLYAFPPKGALAYEAAPFPHLSRIGFSHRKTCCMNAKQEPRNIEASVHPSHTWVPAPTTTPSLQPIPGGRLTHSTPLSGYRPL